MQKPVSFALFCLYLLERDPWTKKYGPIIKCIRAKLWLHFYFKKNFLCHFSLIKKRFPFPVFTMFILNWLSGSGEGRFFKNIIKVLSLLSFPLLKRCDPSFKRSWILYSMLRVQSLVTIFSGKRLWRKKFLKFRQYSFAIKL